MTWFRGILFLLLFALPKGMLESSPETAQFYTQDLSTYQGIKKSPQNDLISGKHKPSFHKKKYKPKGTEVQPSQLAQNLSLPFVPPGQYLISSSGILEIPSYYSHGKRGPPAFFLL